MTRLVIAMVLVSGIAWAQADQPSVKSRDLAPPESGQTYQAPAQAPAQAQAPTQAPAQAQNEKAKPAAKEGGKGEKENVARPTEGTTHSTTRVAAFWFIIPSK